MSGIKYAPKMTSVDYLESILEWTNTEPNMKDKAEFYKRLVLQIHQAALSGLQAAGAIQPGKSYVKSNPVPTYVITVMSRRNGAIAYWSGARWDDDLAVAERFSTLTALKSSMQAQQKTLPPGWVLGVQPVPSKARKSNPILSVGDTVAHGPHDPQRLGVVRKVQGDMAQVKWSTGRLEWTNQVALLAVLDSGAKSSPTRGRARKGNPVPLSKHAKVVAAIDRFKSFTGDDPEHLDRYDVTQPDVTLSIGTLDAISYTTVREGQTELYKHKFKNKARPLLCSSHDGKQLVILGGGYTFTERGIVDDED